MKQPKRLRPRYRVKRIYAYAIYDGYKWVQTEHSKIMAEHTCQRLNAQSKGSAHGR